MVVRVYPEIGKTRFFAKTFSKTIGQVSQ